MSVQETLFGEAGTAASIVLTEERKQEIHKLIGYKLSQLSSNFANNSILPEYVLVMLQNKKNQAQIAQDLEAFLGNYSSPFAEWLFTTLPHHIATESKASTASVGDAMENGDNSLILDIDTLDNDEEDHTNNGYAPISKVTEDNVNKKSRPKSTVIIPRRRTGPPKLPTSRLISEAVRQATTTNNHHQNSVPEFTEPDDPANHKLKSELPPIISERRPKRYRRQQGRGMLSNTSQELTAMRSDNGVKFTVTMRGESVTNKNNKRFLEEENVNGDDEGEEDAEVNQESKKHKTNRCIYWPLCARGDSCLYFHPTELCKHFPNCAFGDKCLFVHPALPVPLQSSVIIGRLPHTISPMAVSCKRGFACSRLLHSGKRCGFTHPPEACKFGPMCTRIRANSCTFSHAPLCKFGGSCSNPACTSGHLVESQTQCKFGKMCKNKSCPFVHEQSAEVM